MRTRTFSGPFETDASDQTTISVRHYGPGGWEGTIGQTSGGFSWGEQLEAPVRLTYDTETGVVTVEDVDPLGSVGSFGSFGSHDPMTQHDPNDPKSQNYVTENRSRIGQLTVASRSPFIVYGDVRGLVAECQLRSEAEAALEADREDCAKLGGGAYSDAAVFMWDDGWEPVPYSM